MPSVGRHFTRCVSICPLLTQSMARLDKRYEANGVDGIHLVSFTVDPEYDTPEVLRKYGELYEIDPARWTLVTGDPAEVRRAVVGGFKTAVGEVVPLGEHLVDIAHTGIAVWRDGELRLLHAPLVGKDVQLSESSLADRIVRIQGQVASGEGRLRLPPEERNLAMVFQDLALWPHLTVSGNLEFVLAAKGVAGDAMRTKIRDWLDRVGLADRGRATVHGVPVRVLLPSDAVGAGRE